MTHYVDFNYIVSAMKKGDTIELSGKAVSFDNIDVVTTCYARLYTDVSDMHGYERKVLDSAHGFHVWRAIRCLLNDLYSMTDTAQTDTYNAPDKYTRLIYNLLELGIAPSPTLFNISMNTGIGMMSEKCFSVGDEVLMKLFNKCTDYYKVINSEFFENFNTFKNMDFSAQIENITGIKVPANLSEWLMRYQWNDTECEYIRTHFKEFCNKYESEMVTND